MPKYDVVKIVNKAREINAPVPYYVVTGGSIDKFYMHPYETNDPNQVNGDHALQWRDDGCRRFLNYWDAWALHCKAKNK